MNIVFFTKLGVISPYYKKKLAYFILLVIDMKEYKDSSVVSGN